MTLRSLLQLITGIALCSSIFGGLFYKMVLDIGFPETFKIWSIALIIAGSLCGGMILIVNALMHDK